MSNDTSTLSGALLEMKDQLIYELGQKGVTASYDSSTGLLGLIGRISDIQTGGSCYHIEFSESSYTAVGGSATLEVYLQSNYQPLSGATVTVTGSDSSLYTGITNSQGLAEITVYNITGTVTFTASYSNVTDTCTVIGESYLFYDACDSSAGLTNYGTSILLEGGSNATMTYDSAENAYKITTPDTKSKCIPIDVLTDVDNFKFEADIKSVSRFGLGFSVSGGTGNGCVIGFSADSDNLYGWKYTNGIFGTLFSDISGLVDTGYLHIIVTVEGTSLDVSITDTNNTTKTKTATLPSYSTRYIGIGLGAGISNQNGYIKNIKVESL